MLIIAEHIVLTVPVIIVRRCFTKKVLLTFRKKGKWNVENE